MGAIVGDVTSIGSPGEGAEDCIAECRIGTVRVGEFASVSVTNEDLDALSFCAFIFPAP
jgi:hypothetical protein